MPAMNDSLSGNDKVSIRKRIISQYAAQVSSARNLALTSSNTPTSSPQSTQIHTPHPNTTPPTASSASASASSGGRSRRVMHQSSDSSSTLSSPRLHHATHSSNGSSSKPASPRVHYSEEEEIAVRSPRNHSSSTSNSKSPAIPRLTLPAPAGGQHGSPSSPAVSPMNSNRSVSMRTLQHSSSSSALLPANQSSSAISSVTNTPRTLEGQQSAQSQHALTKRVRELEIALALSERQRMAELSRNSTLQSRYSALSVKHRETKTRLEAVEDEFRQFRHSKDVRLNAATVSRHSRVASASPMASDSPSTTVEVSEAIAQALERYDFQFQEELEALRSELELARSDNFKLRDEADALAEHVSMVNVSVVELARKLAELEGEVEEEANDDGELHQSLAALLRDAQAAAVLYSPRNSTSSVSNSAPGTPRTSAQSQAAQSPRQQHTPA